MKVLKITGDYELQGEWCSPAFVGFATYDEESNLITGYLDRISDFSALEATSYVVGSYDEHTHELELLEADSFSLPTEPEKLFIFEDDRKEGVWGNCDLTFNFFSVKGKARIHIRESTEKDVREIERTVEHIESGIEDGNIIPVIDDCYQFVHNKFSGVFKDYFGYG